MDERGFALPLVLVILIALAFVGGAGAVLTSTDVKVAGLYSFSNRAGAAAMAGLEHATGHFVSNGAASGWPVTGSIDGYGYQVGIAADVYDFGAGPVQVHWSPSAGLNGIADGAPVWILTSTAARGPYKATQRMRLSSQDLDIDAQAAFTANSSIRLQGNVTLSGLNTDLATGDPVDPTNTAYVGACSENKPAVIFSDGSDFIDDGGSVNLEGNEQFADSIPPFVVTDSTNAWYSPEEVLGLPDGALDSYRQSGTQYDANQPDTLSGITYVTDDFGTTGYGSGNIQGTGILIVHNPLYDPVEWKTAAASGTVPACSPECDPANIGNINGGTFKGIIIADKVDKIDGNVTIYGSIMSLSEIDVNIVGAGTATMNYSCTAIELVSNTIVAPRRLAWSAD